MFSENKTELSIPVVGFMLLGFAALFVGLAVLNFEWGFLDGMDSGINSIVFLASGLLLMFVALFAFKQVFLIEGFVFGIFGLFLFVIGYGAYADMPWESIGFFGIVLSIVSVILAFMAYRVGDLYVMLMGVFAIVALLPMYFADSAVAVAISGIGFIAVAVISLIYAIMDWMLVQDIAADIAEYMYGDDDDEHVCGCGCEHEDKE